jgi:hypothetical protein
MRVIVIESTVYKVTEKDYKSLIKMKEEITAKGYYHGEDVDMMNFIDSKKAGFKEIGVIEFDFRL